jgi:ethanolamine utilization cobalamin adenosyltransferase
VSSNLPAHRALVVLNSTRQMLITESELRELWRDGKQPLPAFPPGTRFSPAAQDFLKAHQLEVRFEAPANHAPQHLEQSQVTPDLKLRGRLESLHAVLMLVAAEARRYQLPQLAAHLDTLSAYCREIQSAQEDNRAVSATLSVAEKSAEEIAAMTQSPESTPIVPAPEDHVILHWLNYLKAQAREAEGLALETDPELTRALNHLGRGVYYLELFFKSGALSWKVA